MKRPLRVKAQSSGQLSDLKRENERLQAQVDLLEKRLEQQSKLKWKLDKSRPKQLPKGCFFRLVIPDSHGSCVNQEAVQALLKDVEAIRPKQVIWLGDHIDCGGFLAQHHTLGYVAETSYTFEDDVAAANTLLDDIFRHTPGAEHHYLEGNHEQRIERWCVTTALRSSTDSKFLLKHLSPKKLLNLEKRKFHWWSKADFHMGLRIPGCIKFGSCYFTHAKRVGRSAGVKLLQDYGYSLTYGHTHTADMTTSRTVHSGEIVAINPGFLGKMQPYYDHSRDITPWSHGYNWQIVDGDGWFLPINVPIIGGRSLVRSMLQVMGL